MSIIQDYWHQILFLGIVIILFTRMRAELHELSKDVEEIRKRELYAKVVEARAELNVLNKQVSSLWEFVNSLRDRIGNSK
tara:strand:+ start:278 stop:517 length:240 start_codon:yes stop_codon:yes gene_type:complete